MAAAWSKPPTRLDSARPYFPVSGAGPAQRGKSGKREAAWLVFASAVTLTLYAMWIGVEMVSAMTALLMVIWPTALGLLGAAYKLEFDKVPTERLAARQESWLEGTASSEGFAEGEGER